MTFGKRTPNGQTFLERRGGKREKREAVGEILVPGKPSQRCFIVDLSGTGARLQMQSIFGVPNTFDLRAFGRIYPARIVRRMTGTLIVEFY